MSLCFRASLLFLILNTVWVQANANHPSTSLLVPATSQIGKGVQVVTARYTTPTTPLQTQAGAAQGLVLLDAEGAGGRVPFRGLAARRFFVLEVGAAAPSFCSAFGLYAPYAHAAVLQANLESLRHVVAQNGVAYNSVVVVLSNYTLDATRDAEFLHLLSTLHEAGGVGAVVNLASERNLALLPPNVTVLTKNNNTTTDALLEDLAAQTLFGGVSATAKLTVSQGSFKAGAGKTTAPVRFAYTPPEMLGISTEKLAGIERIALEGIRAHAFPGCQVLLAKDGKVFYHRAFGSHTYSGEQPVQISDLYDIASITKVAATTAATMRLIDAGKLSLDGQLGEYLRIPNSPLRTVRIRDLLTHTSGLPAMLPIQAMMRNFAAYQCDGTSPDCTCKVAEGMYLKSAWVDSVFYTIYYRLPLHARGHFLYSDINLQVLTGLIETITNERLDNYTEQYLYHPLGLTRIGFTPLERGFKPYEIAPTEQDNAFRHQLLRGYVHDEGAAILGGIGGNAGLFTNANDLAVMFQMFLNKGNYGGEQLLSAATVQQFVTTNSVHHRAMGFDKQSDNHRTNGCGHLASLSTFGHTGFTGTCAWADPESGLIFVFLSNRIHPTRSNAINTLDIRERIHDVAYQAIKSEK